MQQSGRPRKNHSDQWQSYTSVHPIFTDSFVHHSSGQVISQLEMTHVMLFQCHQLRGCDNVMVHSLTQGKTSENGYFFSDSYTWQTNVKHVYMSNTACQNGIIGVMYHDGQIERTKRIGLGDNPGYFRILLQLFCFPKLHCYDSAPLSVLSM